MSNELVARLTKDKELKLKGILQEGLPSILNGLVAHYSFDEYITKNLIEYDSGTFNHNQATTRQYNLNHTVYEKETYNIAGFFKRNILHNGRVYFMIRLETKNGTLIDGTMGLVNGWNSVSGESLYYYITNDIKSSYIDEYGLFQKDFIIPKEAHEGKIKWIRLVICSDGISDTTSFKNISFNKKNYRNFYPEYISGTKIDADGISIEESTTNVISTNFSQYTRASYDGNTCDMEIVEINGIQTLHLYNVVQPNNNTYPRITSPAFTSTVTGDVSVGFNARSTNNGEIKFSLYEGGSTKQIVFTTPTKEFQRYTQSFNSTFNLSSAYFTPKEGNEYWIQLPQVEQKPFATSFTNSSRANSYLELPGYIKNQYSLCLEFTPLVPNDYSSKVNWVLTLNPYSNGLIIWKRTTETYYRIRVNGSDFGFNTGDISPGNKYLLILTFNGTSTKFYLNGIYKGQLAKHFDLPILAIGQQQRAESGSNKFHSLSIYNKTLSEEEIKSLTSTKMKIDKNGNLLNATVKERMKNNDNSIFYFPLDFDTREYGGATKASHETNLRFDDGAFVGQGGINNILGNLSNWSPARASTEQVDVPYGNGRGVKYSSGCLTNTWDGNAYCYQSFDTEATIGVSYGYGCWVYLSEDCDLSYVRISAEHHISGYSSYDLNKKGTWQFLKFTTVSADHPTYHQCRFLIYMSKYNQTTSDFKGHVIYSQPIAIQGSTHTVPVDLGLSRSYLSFNLYRDLKLNWMQDWSIVYFKKPIGTSKPKLLTGYSIESLGGGTTANPSGGYIFWGKNIDSNTLYLSNPSSINPSTYFNNYHMISLVYNSLTGGVELKTWLKEGISIRTFSISPTIPNYFVNIYNCDLVLGGYHYGAGDNKCGTSFKDLFVTQKRLTDTDLSFINNMILSNNNGNIIIRKLQENII